MNITRVIDIKNVVIKKKLNYINGGVICVDKIRLNNILSRSS